MLHFNSAIMKNILKLISLSAMSFCCACSDFLTYSEVSETDEGMVYSDFDRARSLLVNIYAQIPNGLDVYDGAMLACACDEAEYAWPSNTVHNFFNGAWSPTVPMSSTWVNSYAAISDANYFLEILSNFDFSEYENNEDYAEQMTRFGYYEYEARFLRAYFYFELVRTYGDVPLVTHTISPKEANSMSRTPKKIVFDFIEDECDFIADALPNSYRSQPYAETGRATRLAVLALKARALTYAASPLFIEPGEDVTQAWRRAAEANLEVIRECEANGIQLSAYSELWGENAHTASEAIFQRRVSNQRAFEATNFPIGVEGGNSGNCPTQTLVDAYRMQDTGLLWNEPGSGYDEANPYAGRDPRFALTICYNGTTSWPAYNSSPIEIYYGGLNGQPILGATPTGYYLKKFCDVSVDLRPGHETNKRHTWTVFRLGEFYLNYAESLANYFQNPDRTNSDFSTSATGMLNKLKQARSMPAVVTNGSLDMFLGYYENERMVELAFEGHRFWDVRRWKKGEDASDVTFMNISLESGQMKYERVEMSRPWDDKMYFFPIPKAQINLNPNLVQNEGW